MRVIFNQSDTFNVTFNTDNFSVDFSDMHQAGSYLGPYEVTPSQETQTLQTTNKTMTQNVVVNPIPSNYGLITWDGSILTVS